MLLDIAPLAGSQAERCDPRDWAREARLMRVVDALNVDHGARTVLVGNHGG
jgi:hypothetical protein